MAYEVELSIALAETKQLYDAIPSLEAERDDLAKLPAALAEYNAAQAQAKAMLAVQWEQLDNLQREERQLDLALHPRRSHPPAKPVSLTNYEVSGNTDAQTAPSRLVPRLDPVRLREEIKQVATRFARQRINQADPQILADFNHLARDPKTPIGKMLTILPWDIVYAVPLHERESPSDHVQRLQRWREELAAYIDDLRADVETLNRQYGTVQGLGKAWKQRLAEPAAWDALIASACAALAAQEKELAKQIAAKQAHIVALRAELGADSGGDRG